MYSFSKLCLLTVITKAIYFFDLAEPTNAPASSVYSIARSVVATELKDVPAPPRVKTLHGELEGINMTTRGGRNYFAFRGIPYAKYPGRFKTSDEHANWDGILSAKQYGAHCAQVDFFTLSIFSGQEECLHLNVYTPTLDVHANLSVYFFIHGGGLWAGSGDYYDGRYLLDEDIILVTINYRLGPLGFLTYNTGLKDGIPANIGMKDQVMALKWVQKNIHFFGGDPTKVTIGGQSSGAASAHYHVLSSLSEGLFRAAILQSGTAVSFWSCLKNPRRTAMEFAQLMGCPTVGEDGNNRDLKLSVDCLRSLSAEKLARGPQTLRHWNEFPLMIFSAVVEVPGENNHNYRFISDRPREMVKSGNYKPVPMIVGFVRDDGTFLTYPNIVMKERLVDMVENWDRIAPQVVGYTNFSQVEINRINNEYKHLYFPSFKPQDITNKSLQWFMQDRYFEEPVDMIARLHSKYSPIYPYVVTFEGAYGIMELISNSTGYNGVGHCDDLQYLFPGGFIGAPYLGEDTPRKNELEFSKKFVKLWTGFIQTLKPGVWGGYEWKPTVNLNATSTIDYCAIGMELGTFTEDNVARFQSQRKILNLDI